MRRALLRCSTVVCGGFLVPLQLSTGWEVLSFSRIPRNAVHFEASGLRIDVQRSAGPIVYPLPQPMTVTRVVVEGRVSGRLSLGPSQRQGAKGADDYALRVGLVEAGTRRLRWFERLMAAAWVKRLFVIAPPDSGVARISFLNVAESPSHVGATRQHPSSDLFFEHVVSSVDPHGDLTVDHRLDRPTTVLALLLNSDGDDTRSTFSVTIKRLELQ